MYISTKAIVLNAIKYQEKSLIVHCYTEQQGLKSFFVPSAFSSAKNRQKAAYFLPLTLLEVDVNFRNKGSLEHFKSIRIHEPYLSIHGDIHKNAIALFMAETLTNCLKESQPDSELYQFLETALLWLDHHDSIANFHIITLLKLTKYLGFAPSNDSSGDYFDHQNGTFTVSYNNSCLTIDESVLIKKGLFLSYDDEKNHLTGKERQQILALILNYYQVHLDNFKIPQSITVFKELFN